MGDANPGVAREPWVRSGWVAPVLVRVAASRGAAVIPAIVDSGPDRPAMSWCGKSEDAKQ